MYLMINNVRHTCSKRIRTADSIQYLSVTPAVEEIGGTARLYRNDGFLLCEDELDGYARRSYVGTLLTVTNAPEPEPEPETGPSAAEDTDAMLVDHEYRLTLLELGLST